MRIAMTDEDVVTDDDRLDAKQLAAMDSLWRAQRAGDVLPGEAAPIELLIRRGKVSGALKRITEARRRISSADRRP